ncbi:MAG TPA: tetratricopeptide repeat protein [Stellaceae bacterium]|nr:tetratricopeptide repeat protein [Stellaceae bacterium]
MADIFNEIEEDIRRDRAARLWRRFGPWVIALAVLIVLGTAAYVFWQDHRLKQDQALGNKYSQATALLHSGDNAKAIDALKAITASTSDGYGLLARIEVASLQAQGNTQDKAKSGAKADDASKAAGLAALDSIANDSSIGQDYRNLARLLWGLYGVDSLSKAKLTPAIQPLSIAPNPWRFTATEILALADLRAGDTKGALALYKSLADDLDAPQSTRARAAELVTDLQN